MKHLKVLVILSILFSSCSNSFIPSVQPILDINQTQEKSGIPDLCSHPYHTYKKSLVYSSDLVKDNRIIGKLYVYKTNKECTECGKILGTTYSHETKWY